MLSLRTKIKNFFAAYWVPLAIVLVSRVLIFAIATLTVRYDLGSVSFVRWDAIAYIFLSQYGYVADPSYLGTASYIAYFPLLPMLTSLVHVVTGFEYAISGQLLNICALGGACILLYKYVKESADERVATIAVALLCAFPYGVFLSAVYTESLFLCIVFLAYYFLQKERLLYAGIFIGLATITRVVGSVFGIVFVLELFRRKVSYKKMILPIIVAAIPFCLYLVFQQLYFGSYKAFLLAQHYNWNQHAVWPWEGLVLFIKKVLYFDWMSVMWRIDGIWFGTMIVTLIFSYKKVPQFFWWGSALSMLLILSNSDITGMSRYMMLTIPFYMYWSQVLSKKPIALYAVLSIFLVMMSFNTVLFVLGKYIF